MEKEDKVYVRKHNTKNPFSILLGKRAFLIGFFSRGLLHVTDKSEIKDLIV